MQMYYTPYQNRISFKNAEIRQTLVKTIFAVYKYDINKCIVLFRLQHI